METSSSRKRGREPDEEGEEEEKTRLKRGEIFHPPPEYLKRVEGIAESAFAQEYQRVGGLDNVESLREKLEETGDMWKTEKTMIAPVVTLVQSSGWGKSRTTCELANLDLPSDEQTGDLLLAEVEDLGRLCGYGRPLWQALVKASASAEDVYHMRLVWLHWAAEYASTSIRMPQLSLIWLQTHWATEPLVAAAAAHVLRAQGKVGTGWKECLEALVTGMKRGWVDRGYRGELVARVLLLLAVDSLGRNSWKCFTFDELCHGLSGKSLSDLIREDEQNSASPTPKAPGGGEEAQVEVNMPPPPVSVLKRSTRGSRVKVNKKFLGQPQVASASLSKAPGEKPQVKVNTPPPEVKSPSPMLTASKAPGGSTHDEGETKQAGGSIDGSGKEEIHRNMGEGKFFCLLFRKTDFRLQDLTAKDLLEFGKAGVGIICLENEWGMDIIIIGFFGDTFSLETMTLILVQMLSSSAGPQGWTRLKVPYASLVLNVAHVPSSSVRYRTRKLVTEALLKKTPANHSMAIALHDAHPECKGLQGWTEL
ncbi:hypothetical protein SELMODRAFT_432612 [Selaginella moellendorffii]|uniref:Uncharacterized protein n=1 Tax=Selaginella moellendorffii TaxID=88036 RepID=D8TGJ3_SELML|nr:hypothetical protein SELMODRAFT_432612 [Selaginella moellendorffii]